MKKLEILLFDEHLDMLKAVRENHSSGTFADLEKVVNMDVLDEFLNTLSKCITSDEYYEAYRKYNDSLLP